VVLMDIRLSGDMDGIKAAKEIRSFSKAWIIFMSGYSDESLKERAMALNPVAYLNKPTDSYEIDSAIARAYDKR
jgi:CheY-like chemotaxis protein